jgi:hypothetical protein
MLPLKSQLNYKGISAWDKYSLAEIKRILVIFIIGIFIFEVAAIYAFEQISLVQFLVAACVLLFLLVLQTLTLSRLYAEQLALLQRRRLSSARFGLSDEQVVSRTTFVDPLHHVFLPDFFRSRIFIRVSKISGALQQ